MGVGPIARDLFLRVSFEEKQAIYAEDPELERLFDEASTLFHRGKAHDAERARLEEEFDRRAVDAARRLGLVEAET